MTRSKQQPKPRPGYLTRIDPTAPLDVARVFLVHEFRAGDHRSLHHHRGMFYAWNGAAYIEITADDLRSKLYKFLDRCKTGVGQGEKIKPDQAQVNNVFHALAAAAQLDSRISAPIWLNNTAGPPADQLIACANGLLHLPTKTLQPHSADFFTHNAVDFAFDPDAPEPTHWLKFLAELWPDDRQAIETLQEIFGYCLTGDTSQQKIFLMVGPKRGGKGTIARVLRSLIGADSTASPTLAGLSTNFGIAPLIGKRMAIVSDARLGRHADQQQVIAERLLSISGEDAITIDRKYLSAWTGRLQARFLILSNELPQISDASGALASRFVMLVMRRSFYGREDHGLLNRLLPELPGIMNWAIEGWRRLNARGHFVVPRSSADAVQQLEDLGSPIGAFVREHCVVAPGRRVEAAGLFLDWCDWCAGQNRHPGTAEQFGKELHAAVPGIRVTQPRPERRRTYEGIALRPGKVLPRRHAPSRVGTKNGVARGAVRNNG